ncbi:MAG TPA: bi-domain-containing oxidoreductase [Burkholderiales bacterium]|nr:bi-domain-containing oxidoreductase [Burkholderiales bacterium]
MKQVLQNLSSGETVIVDVPRPAVPPGHVLVATRRSLVSAGTERMLVDFGKAGLIEKARQQPDKLRMVLDKIRTDGLAPTLRAVRNKLDQPIAMGYCNVGTVLEVGAGVTRFKVGDRIVSNGKHAEVVTVPVNLCAKVADGVSDEDAAFTVLAAIALQGIRLAQPTLGETVVVTGLGLIGLIAVQLLRAQGCRVLGIDPDAGRLELARTFGAEVVDVGRGADPVAAAQAYSRGIGADAVIVTASTKSSEPMHQAALMCRKRGRIVLVGVTGLELSRADFYEKELTFQVSCSYGPGRYDRAYEEQGHDYPVGYVRWTEQRNFEAVLDMLGDGRVDFAPLVTHRIAFDDAEKAYALLSSGEPSLGIVLEYAAADAARAPALMVRTTPLPAAAAEARTGAPVMGVIGAGGYGTAVLIPALRDAGARLKTIASSGGVSAVHAGRKFGFEQATTDTAALIADDDIDTLVVCTRHDTHARFACEALRAGKHVFVEKPLAITPEGLDAIAAAHADALARGRTPLVMVGFNRRFAPHVQRMKALLATVASPKSFVITVNAGAIPADHWTRDPRVGGGRIVGEACHFIDLMRFLAGAPIGTVTATPAASDPDDAAILTLTFADGSSGTVHYLTDGHKSFPKERVEVFCAGRILQLDNFRRLTGYGWPGLRSMRLWSQDKGNAACAGAFVRAVATGGASPIAFDELLEVSRVTLEAAARLRTGA